MKFLNTLCFVLFLFLESNTMIKSCFAQSKLQDPLSSWEVTIWNHMYYSSLTVHCKSKDDDLGVHVLGYRKKYNWAFDENLWQTTLFWCNFESKYGRASGEVFWPEYYESDLTEYCDHIVCNWSAGKFGISFHFHANNSYELRYPWK